jgi:hypothetical protein
MRYEVTPQWLADDCRVSTRSARRYLKANHTPVSLDLYGLTLDQIARAKERLANMRQVECIGVALSATRRQRMRG